MKEIKFKIGDVVAVKVEDNYRRINKTLDNIDKWCFDGVVTKVGRKYITVEFKKSPDGYTFSEVFNKEDDYRQKHEIGYADYKLYMNKKEVIEEFEAHELYEYIRSMFDVYKNKKYTLIQLRKIKEIIEE